MVETFFQTLKSEPLWPTIFYTRQQATRSHSAATLTGSTIPSGVIPPSTLQARVQFEKQAAE